MLATMYFISRIFNLAFFTSFSFDLSFPMDSLPSLVWLMDIFFFFKQFLFIYLFFGCPGSLLLHVGFL